MRNTARLSAQDRSDLFRNTADRMGLSDAIVEKDFWVCFTLDYLFHRSPWKEAITFKGGIPPFYFILIDLFPVFMKWFYWYEMSAKKRSGFCSLNAFSVSVSSVTLYELKYADTFLCRKPVYILRKHIEKRYALDWTANLTPAVKSVWFCRL